MSSLPSPRPGLRVLSRCSETPPCRGCTGVVFGAVETVRDDGSVLLGALQCNSWLPPGNWAPDVVLEVQTESGAVLWRHPDRERARRQRQGLERQVGLFT